MCLRPRSRRSLSNSRLTAQWGEGATPTGYLSISAPLDHRFSHPGEVCLLDENGTPTFEEMRSRAVRKDGALMTYFAFDLLFLNGRDLRSLPLLERQTRLRKLITEDEKAPSVLI